MSSRVLAATWVVPVASPPIRSGAVVVTDELIDWVGPLSRLPGDFAHLPVERFDGVLTPGLVNAHTHLQYTGFAELGRGRFTDFEDWSAAFEVVYDAVQDADEWRRASRRGAVLALESGTTQLAEIVTDDEARGALEEFGLGGIEYLEAIAEVERRWSGGGRERFLARLAESSAVEAGISPHAPYSLDGDVIRDLVSIALERGLRIHSHVAESSVESRLYSHGDAAVLEIYGDLRDEFELVRRGGAGQTTATYAESVGLLGEYSHLAHAIYLDRAERDLLLATETRIALCPRSNSVIGLDAPPVAAYLEEGHDIAVGTDSLASSPSLDLMGDVAALARLARAQGYRGGDLAERLFHAATRGGARALGRPDGGALQSGAIADIAVFDIDPADGDVLEALVNRGEGTCVMTIVRGRTVFDRHGGGAPDPH